MKDGFFDIVFNVIIDNSTYNFEDNTYKKTFQKNFYKVAFIFGNGFILLCCIYVLIFILIPVICYRIGQCSSKKMRISEYKEKIDNTTQISLLKERLNSYV